MNADLLDKGTRVVLVTADRLNGRIGTLVDLDYRLIKAGVNDHPVYQVKLDRFMGRECTTWFLKREVKEVE